MPPLPAVPQTLQARMFWTMAGKLEQGIRLFLGFSGTSPTPTILNNLATLFLAQAVVAGFAGLTHSTNVLTGAHLVDLTSSTGAEGGVETSIAGTRTGGALPVDAAFVTSYEIARRYRGGHPRTAWPFGVDSDLTTPQAWKPASVTTFETAVRGFLAGVVGLTNGGTTISSHVSVSQYHGFTPVTSPTTGRVRNVPNPRTPPLIQPVTAILGRDYVGSQRRRRFSTS